MVNKETNNLKKEFIFIKSVSTIEKYNFYEYLSVMVDAGVGFSNALESVQSRITNPFFSEKIEELNTYIKSGDSFSKSMRKVPQIFDIGEISIIEAGEQTGKLVQSLQKLSDDLKKMDALKKKVKGALTYPIVIFSFLILAVIIVLTYVIPQLLPLFETAEVELPGATQALIATSEFLQNNYWYIIFVIFTLIVAFIGYKSTKEGKTAINNILIQAPLIGKVYKNYALANISSSLGSLVGSGVSIVKALKLTGKASGSSLYEGLFDKIITRVSNGSKIVESMEEVDPEGIYFPADFLQMLSVGERAAKLEQINIKINEQYMKEVDYSLGNMTKWIEPLALLLAGGFVLWFAFAIFGAILKVTETVS
ncbi:MAG: type II secretion system F family protein [Candidatus Gracilibacteria bacterium]|nr:type II secretion system F family protein [Candidatus Gracilibacteria bacterium]MDQ7022229.1 type II secretion system F family protein [Candidatus Gracilibacteria bacterium]